MQNIDNIIIQIIEKYSFKKDISKEDLFDRIGIDEVDSVMIFFDIERALSIYIDDNDLEFTTVSDFINYISVLYTNQKNKVKIN